MSKRKEIFEDKNRKYALGNSFIDGSPDDKPVIDWAIPADEHYSHSLSRFDR